VFVELEMKMFVYNCNCY